MDVASVSSPTPDPVPANNAAAATTTVPAPPTPTTPSTGSAASGGVIGSLLVIAGATMTLFARRRLRTMPGA
ncbi:MAG: hypothetical protein JOY68_09240 [Candidatus Dormibacteraeota bacterium]|nr:hypothetical protein [Candidatus Dormibacteraeota bacterium]